MKNQKGFSLLEFIAFLVIIGLLAVIAVPHYQKVQKEKDLPKTNMRILVGSEAYYTAKALIAKHCNNPRIKKNINQLYDGVIYSFECNKNLIFNANIEDSSVTVSRSNTKLLSVNSTAESADLQVLLTSIYEKFNPKENRAIEEIDESRKKEIDALLE